MKNKSFKNKSFINSFNNAIGGLKYAFTHEKNVRFHVAAAILVIIGSMFLDISKEQLILLLLTISLVIVAELINTAIEVIVNIIIKVYHPKAKVIKDVAAGAVMVASINAMIVGYLIFIDRMGTGLEIAIERFRLYTLNFVLICVLLTVFVVIIVKLIYNKGTPLKGGMPSGHTAIAFSITTAIALWFPNIIVSLLCLGLSLLVAQSRVEGKIHTFFEVIAGAFVGILVTLFVYKLFY